MNLYIQLFIIFMITYYLFFTGRKSTKSIEKQIINQVDKKIENFRGSTFGSRTVNNMFTPYNKNYTDLNDLSLPKAKNLYPIDFDVTSINKKRVKYLKSVDRTLDEIRLLANEDKETIYNVQSRNPIPIDSNPKPFLFLSEYLVNKLNLLSANLYTIEFVKFNEIKGEEVDEQFKVNFKMEFKMKTKKDSYEDKKNDFKFNVKADVIINKPNSQLKTNGKVFFRTLFVDEDLVNHYMPYNV
jgi:hypothetical protein